MSLHLIVVADQPKVTDWWSAIVATVGVCATVFVGVTVALFANGYRMRIRAKRDKNGEVLVQVFNSGRVRGTVGPVRFVTRSIRSVRLIRWLNRTNQIEPVLRTGQPAKAVSIEPGDYVEWRVPKLDFPCRDFVAPRLSHPLRNPVPDDDVRPRRVRLRIDRGLYRPRYLRYQRVLPFRKIGRLVYVLNPAAQQQPAGGQPPPPQGGPGPAVAPVVGAKPPPAPGVRRQIRDPSELLGRNFLRVFLVVAVPSAALIAAVTIVVIVRTIEQVMQAPQSPPAVQTTIVTATVPMPADHP
jgi:hypothetical protein